jgi:hypothetical protein
VVNGALWYVLAAAATFLFYFAAEIRSPSEYYPYFGQAIAAAWWVTAMLLFGAPVLLIALVVVDELARPVVHPRRYVMALGLLPGVFAAVVALAAVVASGYADAWPAVLWLLLVGGGFGRLMRLPPPTSRSRAL